MSKYNLVSTCTAIILLPFWVLGFLFGFLLLRPFWFGLSIGYSCLDIWKYKLLTEQQKNDLQDRIRAEAIEQLIRSGQIPPEFLEENQEQG